ncbi:MAG: CHAD domain-containing protein [Chloroflexi bacterium]|nr:CHAD domain-containing protein [Chloroflexota bacterium]
MTRNVLTQNQATVLQTVADEASTTVARRAQVILDWDAGYDEDAISERVGWSTRTVSKWIQAWDEQGLGIFPEDVLPLEELTAPDDPMPDLAEESPVVEDTDLVEVFDENDFMDEDIAADSDDDLSDWAMPITTDLEEETDLLDELDDLYAEDVEPPMVEEEADVEQHEAIEPVAEVTDPVDEEIAEEDAQAEDELAPALSNGKAEEALEAEAAVSLAALCQQYGVHLPHAEQVARLAVDLFEGMQPIHRLPAADREIAYVAGLLHNVAFAGGRKAHHTRGRDILLNTRIEGIEPVEQQIIAISTAFHRKDWKSERFDKEDAYIGLAPADQQRAAWISAIVRIADGLDYSHSHETQIKSMTLTDKGIDVSIEGPFAELDGARAYEKADLWHAMSGVALRLFVLDSAWGEAGLPITALAEPRIASSDVMAEVGRAIVAYHFNKLREHESGARSGEDIEDVHQARVAIRRMRSALEVFGHFYTDKVRDRLDKGLRRTARAMSRVRDLDVQIEQAASYSAEQTEARLQDLDPLIDYWQGQRGKARKAMLSYLNDKDYRKLIARLASFTDTPGKAAVFTPGVDVDPIYVHQVVPRMIYERYEAVRAYEPMLEYADIETLHDLRKEIKRFRYTLEFFAETLGPDVKTVIEAVKQVQDHLGLLNDAQVTLELLQDYMERALKRRMDGKKEAAQPQHLYGVMVYLDHAKAQLDHQIQTLPAAFEVLVTDEVRRSMGLAVSAL